MARRSTRREGTRRRGDGDGWIWLALGAGALLLLSGKKASAAELPRIPPLKGKPPFPPLLPEKHMEPSADVELGAVLFPIRKPIRTFAQTGFGTIYQGKPGESVYAPVSGEARRPARDDAELGAATGGGNADNVILVEKLSMSGEHQLWIIESPNIRPGDFLPSRVTSGQKLGALALGDPAAVGVALVIQQKDGTWLPVDAEKFLGGSSEPSGNAQTPETTPGRPAGSI